MGITLLWWGIQMVCAVIGIVLIILAGIVLLLIGAAMFDFIVNSSYDSYCALKKFFKKN